MSTIINFNDFFRPELIILLLIGLFSALYQIIVVGRNVNRVRRAAYDDSGKLEKVSGGDASCSSPKASYADAPLLGLSVIVYSRDAAEVIENTLTELLTANYPGKFEVVVTIDGHSPMTEDIITRLSAIYSNLRMTFVPEEAHALSREKLAMTLGVKAAKYEYVLLTDAFVSGIDLRSIGCWFTNGKDVVVGRTYLQSDRKVSRGFSAFTETADTVTWLSSALAGHPYRCDIAYMAFRKSLFFDNRGFAETVGYRYGIDDMFFSRIATGANTVVMIEGYRQAPQRCNDIADRRRLEKIRHIFTEHGLGRRYKLIFGAGSLSAWIWLAATIAMAIVTFPDPLPPAAMLIIGLVWIIIASRRWYLAARALHIPMSAWCLPWAIFTRPISNLRYRRLAGSKKWRYILRTKPSPYVLRNQG